MKYFTWQESNWDGYGVPIELVIFDAEQKTFIGTVKQSDNKSNDDRTLYLYKRFDKKSGFGTFSPSLMQAGDDVCSFLYIDKELKKQKDRKIIEQFKIRKKPNSAFKYYDDNPDVTEYERIAIDPRLFWTRYFSSEVKDFITKNNSEFLAIKLNNLNVKYSWVNYGWMAEYNSNRLLYRSDRTGPGKIVGIINEAYEIGIKHKWHFNNFDDLSKSFNIYDLKEHDVKKQIVEYFNNKDNDIENTFIIKNKQLNRKI